MIDLNALMIAIRTRLKADATLTALIGDVYRGAVPSEATWIRPNIEIGVQTDDQFQDTSYQTKTQEVIIRLMCHGKGKAPGVGSFASNYAALVRADTVLFASPLSVANMAIIDFRRWGGIPEAMPVDQNGYRRPQVGSLYRARIDGG